MKGKTRRKPIQTAVFIAVFVAIIGLIGTICAAIIGSPFFNKWIETMFPPIRAPVIIPSVASPALNNPDIIKGFYMVINGNDKPIRVEPSETKAVPLNSTLFIEPIIPEPVPGTTLDWVACNREVKITPLSENRVSYVAKVTGSDCVRLYIKTSMGGVLDDADIKLIVQ